MAKKNAWMMTTAWILALLGGASLVLGAYNTFDVFNLLGNFSKFVQLVSGISISWLSVKMLMKVR